MPRRSHGCNAASHCAPAERGAILEIMRLHGWSASGAAQRFVVHPGTVRDEQRAVEEKLPAE